MSIYTERAADTMEYYAENHGVGSGNGLDESTLTDLLTDLIHLIGLELFTELTQGAVTNYTFVDEHDE